ncbi:hypothetical protein FNW54_09470 [Bacteroides sp. HF-5092]|uniref:hypothetical protein n=1 Tax=Bacteroides TaxID=816 RepID=UPI001177A6B0|nr:MULTISPECIES: hypothetical protein [Bacteroides]TRX45606.1 hypothetical protein FNW54_09470 [Bacteroides sp. HF-5092]
MKNLLFLVAITFTMLFTACSKNDESELTNREKVLAQQEEVYQAVKANIVGHWKGAQRYNNSDKSKPMGWRDISQSDWKQEYIFNFDGTCTIIYSSEFRDAGTFSVIKNDDFVNFFKTQAEVFLIITFDDNEIVRTQNIWLDGEYLRLSSGALSGYKEDEHSGGEAAIRYKKE